MKRWVSQQSSRGAVPFPWLIDKVLTGLTQTGGCPFRGKRSSAKIMGMVEPSLAVEVDNMVPYLGDTS